jgi:hypothetical protein
VYFRHDIGYEIGHDMNSDIGSDIGSNIGIQSYIVTNVRQVLQEAQMRLILTCCSDCKRSNGSVSFQLAQLKVGEDREGKVPDSIVLYIDGPFLKKGILIRPVYNKCKYIGPDIIPDVISKIIPDIAYCLFGQLIISIMTNL